ncbi:MAG: hypothetical protein HY854_05905 [Burkholderiales bacterium]|nr:hypothetical protein [Burkholderiales bacterium]
MADSSSAFGPGRDWFPLTLELPSNLFERRLFAIEGIDGSGKTSLTERVSQILREGAIDVLTTTAPSPWLRDHPAWIEWHHRPETRPDSSEFGLSLLSLGDRLLHQARIIVPALEKGLVVLSDRYVLSVLVDWCTEVHRIALSQLLIPELGFWLDVSPSVARARILSRNEPAVLRDPARLEMISARYAALAQRFNYVRIQADKPFEEVANEIALVIKTKVIHK